MNADPDRACGHENFQANVEVNRLQAADDDPQVVAYSASIRIWCIDCDETFRWIGVPAGVLPNRPACSIDEAELRAPLRPASSDSDFGLAIPGVAIRFREP